MFSLSDRAWQCHNQQEAESAQCNFYKQNALVHVYFFCCEVNNSTDIIMTPSDDD